MSFEKGNSLLVLLTGASRCGKTTLAKKFERDPLLSSVVHQDDFFHESSDMPKRKFHGSFINVSYWDAAASLRLLDLEAAVKHALRATADTRRVVVVEGHGVLHSEFLRQTADKIVLINVDKWTCFERRRDAASAGRRQCYLAYLEAMWADHCALFTSATEHPNSVVYRAGDAAFDQLASLLLVDAHCAAAIAAKRVFDDTLRDAAPHYPRQPFVEPRTFIESTLRTLPAANRIAAALLAHALGDAGGAWCEFTKGKTPVFPTFVLDRHTVFSDRAGVRGAPPGSITDDHMMLLQSARAIVDNGCAFDRRKSLLAYIEWAQQTPAGMGRNTRALFQTSTAKHPKKQLEAYEKAHAAAHADATQRSISNGSLMRAASLLLVRGSRDAVLAAAEADAALSNNWPENRGASRLYLAVLYELVHHNRSIDLSTWIDAAFISANSAGCAEVEAVARAALFTTDGNTDISRKERKGSVLTALWVALRYASTSRNDVGRTLCAVVNLGGDTDTNAAITGALLGAAMGLDTLLEQQHANLTVLLNVPYKFATLKNVLNLEPRTIAPLLSKWHAVGARVERNVVGADDDGEENRSKRARTE